MPKPIEARGLARVRVEPALDNENARVLILEDVANNATGYIINPEGLEALLEPALSLASQWAGKSCPQPENAQATVRQRIVLPATRLELTQGRDEHECAVRFFLVKM